MSSAAHEDLRSYVFPRTAHPVIRARQRMIARWAAEPSPEMRKKLVDEGWLEGYGEGWLEGWLEGHHGGQLEEARNSLRRVLALCGLALSAEDEGRIDMCPYCDTLHRWLEQALVAASAAEALQ